MLKSTLLKSLKSLPALHATKYIFLFSAWNLLPPRRLCNFHCLSVSNFAQKLPNGLHEIFREGWQCQWAND